MKRANPTAIGLFIVIGLALGVAGLLLFGSSRLFTKSRQCVLYFDTSVNGLNQGAPVKYRGVTIGAVKRLMIHFNQASNDLFMPVIIDLRDKLIKERFENLGMFEDVTNLQADIERGLRGSLQAESLVTGVLYVDLDTIPDAPPPVFHQLKPVYIEIPTRSTQIQRLLENLARVDVSGLENKLTTLITNLNVALVNLRLGEMSAGITNLISTINRFASSTELTNTLVSVQTTLAQYRLLAEKVTSRVDPLADSATNALAQASQALAQVRAEVQNLGALLAPDSPLRNDLSLSLEQLGQAAQNISALAEFLQRHPNALITGRQKPKGNDQ